MSNTNETAFSFEDVTKQFGKAQALRGLSFAAPTGSVIGLVGRNGAGKSTALRCLMGLQRPTAGRVRLLGADPWDLPVPLKQRTGYMSERDLPFPGATAGDLTGFCAPLYPRWDAALASNILLRFGINAKTKLKNLSLGQRRTVALMLALCPRPDVLVLDEPAANLDPAIRREFLEQVLELVAGEQRTVIFSSHILSDVERVADRIAFLHEGRLLSFRQTDELKERVRRLRLIFPEAAPVKVNIPGAVRARHAGREILVTVDGFEEGLPSRVEAETGARVEVQPLGLEELFIDLAGDHDGAEAAQELA